MLILEQLLVDILIHTVEPRSPENVFNHFDLLLELVPVNVHPFHDVSQNCDLVLDHSPVVDDVVGQELNFSLA